MTALNFSDMRSSLKHISKAVGEGYLVSCAWDGSFFRVSVGRRSDGPETWREPWVMTFDSEADYSSDPDRLITEFAHGVKAWFGSAKDQAEEITRLLTLAAAK